MSHFCNNFVEHFSIFSNPNYRVSVSDATITPHTLNFVKKLVSTFGIGVENVSSSVSGNSGNSGNDALQRRSQVNKALLLYIAVLGIRMFLSLPDPDQLVRGTDPDPEILLAK